MTASPPDGAPNGGEGARSRAVALGDVKEARDRLADANPAVVVSGGNVNLTDHAELARAGLFELGRYAEDTTREPCPADDCDSDRAHYEMLPKPGGSYEVRLFTCVECGHKWRES